jgi:hypothetical protein
MTAKRKALMYLGCLAVSASTAAPSAFAIPPHQPDLVKGGNQWTITFYDDTSPIHTQWATQRICFYPAGVQGTHQLYNWVSVSYPDWNGRATQEGDQIFMHGDFQWPFGKKDGGHDGIEWQLVTASPAGEAGVQPKGEIGTGHWKEWVEDGRLGINIGWGNTFLRRVGSCPFIRSAEAITAGEQLKVDLPLDQGGDNPANIPAAIYKKNAAAADAETPFIETPTK